jgi:hypothetical protein
MLSFLASSCRQMWNRISCPNEVAKCCLILTLGALIACKRDSASGAKDTLSTTSAQPPAQSGALPDTSCQKSGTWRPCSVLDRLEHAGLVVTQRAEPTRIPLFSVPGTTYETSRATIHVFLYPDQDARRRDTAQLDSVAVAPKGGTFVWSDPAILVTSNNLAAVVVSPNERQAERIVLALSAGLPR